ncbi:MAG: hypothetical protein NC323_03555 [Oxalobacter formigenes]|nr:hypothetical protein [Oxalobacter formigenes]
MPEKIYWDGNAMPVGITLDRVLYDIRRSDAGEGLIMDAITAADIIEDSEGVLTFDALVSPYAKLNRKMEIMKDVMERAGDKVKPLSITLTEPFKQRGVANVAAIFELSDGQTVSIFFHNPDTTPAKIQPSDEVVSWKWLLNKKDITILVAPEKGTDLNIREVARRIMKLAEKNSTAFQRANSKRAERMKAIQELKDEVALLEKELEKANHELEVEKIESEDRKRREAEDAAKAAEAPVAEKPAEPEPPKGTSETGNSAAGNTADQPASEPSFDAYKAALGDAAALLNAAVSGVNWDGITSKQSAEEEIFKLRAVQDKCIKEIIGKAAESLGLAPWDWRLDGIRKNSEEGKAWLAVSESSETVIRNIRNIAKKIITAKGKEEVAALTKDSPLADVAAAMFHKEGIDLEGRIPPIVTAIENKDADRVWDILRSNSNKASANVFEHATCIKLAKNQKDRLLQIDEWAGITPEKRAEMDARAKKLEESLQARNLRISEMRALDAAWHQMGGMRYAIGKTAQDLLRHKLEKGADFDMHKHGVVSRPVVAWHGDGGSFYWPKYQRKLMPYLKHIYEFLRLGKKYFGTLEKTLAYFDAKPVNLSGNELGVFPDTEEGKKQLRQAAIERMKFMRDEMQADKSRGMDCPILGSKVYIRGRGIREVEQFSGNPDKLKLVAGIREIFQNAYAKSWEENYK